MGLISQTIYKALKLVAMKESQKYSALSAAIIALQGGHLDENRSLWNEQVLLLQKLLEKWKACSIL